jgi:outer membrane protein assembly factor BamB
MQHDHQETTFSVSASSEETQASPSLLQEILQRLTLLSTATAPFDAATQAHQEDVTQPWYSRAAAVRALGKRGAEAPLDQLLAALDDEHESVRAVAVHALGKLGERAPVTRLLDALNDPSWQVRETAVLALAQPGVDVPPAALLKAQQDSAWPVRDAAQAALLQSDLAAGFLAVEHDPLPGTGLPHYLGDATEHDLRFAVGEPSIVQIPPSATSPGQPPEKQHVSRQAKPAARSPRHQALWHRLSLVAAVLVAALLVSSLLLILQAARSTVGGNGQAAVYFVHQSTVWKVDASTGSVAWSFPTGTTPEENITVPTLVEKGHVYVVGQTKAGAPILSVVDAQTGHVLHSAALPQQHQVFSLFFGSDDDLYLVMAKVNAAGQPGQEEAYVLDERSGTVGKMAPIQGCPSALPWAIAQGVLYSTGSVNHQGSTNSFLCASRITDGALLYRIPASPGGAPRNIMLTQAQVVNGVLYAIGRTELGQVTNYVYAFNARTGAQLWRSAFVPAEWIYTIHVVQETVYLTTNDGQVFALNAASGQVRWQKSLQAGSVFQVIGGIMYVATFPKDEPANVSHAESLYALSALDGSVLWQRLLKAQGGSLYPTWFVVSNGTIYVGSIDGRSDQAHLESLKATDGFLVGQITLPWLRIDPSISGFDFSVAP